MDFLTNEILWLLPLIFWISGIFYLSSNKGSVSNTSRFVSPIFHFLFPRANEQQLKKYHHYLRKLCHFFGYGILAIFASLAFYNNSTINLLAKYWQILAFGTVVFIASADEIKQSFYDSRDGSVYDVVIDSLGGLTMILLFWGLVKM